MENSSDLSFDTSEVLFRSSEVSVDSSEVLFLLSWRLGFVGTALQL
jgi:hypothetical protein